MSTVRGTSSGAKGIFIEQKTSTSAGFAYLNNVTFEKNEVVVFEQSGVTGNATDIDAGSPNITSRFTFDNGQRSTYYDYARIHRRSTAQVPAKKLLVCFGASDYDPADPGDFTTANSYINHNFKIV